MSQKPRVFADNDDLDEKYSWSWLSYFAIFVGLLVFEALTLFGYFVNMQKVAVCIGVIVWGVVIYCDFSAFINYIKKGARRGNDDDDQFGSEEIIHFVLFVGTLFYFFDQSWFKVSAFLSFLIFFVICFCFYVF